MARSSYSVREAATALKIGKTTAARSFDELRSHGFIAVVRESAFSWKVQQARRWRLTEHRCDETNTEATKDFMRWQPEKKNTVPGEVRPVPLAAQRVSLAGR